MYTLDHGPSKTYKHADVSEFELDTSALKDLNLRIRDTNISIYAGWCYEGNTSIIFYIRFSKESVLFVWMY